MSYNQYITSGQFKFIATQYAIEKFNIEVSGEASMAPWYRPEWDNLVKIVKTGHKTKVKIATYRGQPTTEYKHEYSLLVFNENKKLIAKSDPIAGHAINSFHASDYAKFLVTLKEVENAE